MLVTLLYILITYVFVCKLVVNNKHGIKVFSSGLWTDHPFLQFSKQSHRDKPDKPYCFSNHTNQDNYGLNRRGNYKLRSDHDPKHFAKHTQTC